MKMRNRLHNLLVLREYLGALLFVFGLLILFPLIPLVIYYRAGAVEADSMVFLVPAAVSFFLGGALKWRRPFRPLSGASSMLLCVVGWLALSAVGAVPFCAGLNVSYLDAYFESVCGFTTTGITMLTGLDTMPRSILFWRSFIQWLGGLGILTFLLLVVSAGGSAHIMFTAESHKIFSKRPAPGLFRTLRILWSIYAAFTVLIAALLLLAGMSVYDAVVHALTCLSTGGYSPYDASIAYFGDSGRYPYYVAIEYVIIFGMVLGGTNFFIHYRVLTGGVRALWDNLESKLWWGMLAGATLLVALSRCLSFGEADLSETVRHSLFQVVSIATTTGYATRGIGTAYFPPLAKQVFLVLMVVGGCVGSTSGGIKVLRIGVLLKMVVRQVQRVMRGRRAVNLILVDGDKVDAEEIRRVSALFFAWVALLAVGGGITALLSPHLGPMEAASGMFSALGNIGPCYISVEAMGQLDPLVKLTYIIGMLAGRLEILPVLLLFSRKAWQ